MNKSIGNITHIGGWNGGEYLIEGENLFAVITQLDIHRDDMELLIKGKVYPVIFWTEDGQDNDHGHVYQYVKRHIGVWLLIPLIGEVRHSIEDILFKTKIRKIILRVKT